MTETYDPIFVHGGGPIHVPDGPEELPGWYFCEENWCDYHGPFSTRDEAKLALIEYAKTL